MPDRRFNHVVAVAQGGSFTVAAEQMGMTQSGITKSIADLERELGYSLFHRTARGALLTERGREFVERASRLLEDARTLLKGDGDKDPFARTLRVGVCPASIEWLLAIPLVTLLKRHSSIRLDVVGSNAERIVQLLRNGGVDVAFGFEDAFSEWTDLKRELVAPMSAVLFARKDHPILGKKRPGRSDLAMLDFVAPSDSRPYGKIIRGLYEEQGTAWQRHVHSIDYFPIVRRIVAATDAIGVATEDTARSPDFKASFEVVPGERLFPPLPMCCAFRSRWEPTPPVRAFLKVMKEKIPARMDSVTAK